MLRTVAGIWMGLAIALAWINVTAIASAGPDGSDAPMPAPVIDLASRARVTLDLPVVVGGAPVGVRETGPALMAAIEGDALVIDALRGARGSSEVVVELEDGRSARLEVRFASAPWAFLDGRPYGATLVHVDDPMASTEAWAWVDSVVHGTLARAETGVERAVLLMPVPVIDGSTYASAPEPEDPDLAHACGHAVGGPFSAIEAAPDPADGGAIERPHTSYQVALPPDDDARHVRLRNPRAGRLTLHASALIGLRLRGPDGSLVRAAFADDTSRCEGLRGFVQYDLADVGTYDLELGPTAHETVTVVYERGWVVEP